VRIFFLVSLVAGVAVALYTGLSSHAAPSAVFLGIAAFTMVLVIGLVTRAARVLVEPDQGEVAQATGRRKKELEREKQSLLKALKELEFDHEMGKISDADFRDIGGQYRARAVRVLRQLDEQGADYKELVEKELKARRAAAGAPDARDGDAKDAKAEDKLGRCASCGTTNDSDAVFCKKCGKKVAA
jgi:hypothetical protein